MRIVEATGGEERERERQRPMRREGRQIAVDVAAGGMSLLPCYPLGCRLASESQQAPCLALSSLRASLGEPCLRQQDSVR